MKYVPNIPARLPTFAAVARWQRLAGAGPAGTSLEQETIPLADREHRVLHKEFI